MHAAFGNLFYSVVVNGVLYARHKGYWPWVRFHPSWVRKTMGKVWAAHNGTALWERFFDPFCAGIEEWMANCASTVTLVPAVNETFWYPMVQQRWRWPVRPYYNKFSVERLAAEEEGWVNTFNESVYHRWRSTAHTVVVHAHRLNARSRIAAEERWRALNPTGRRPVLAMHMRGTDKRGARPRSPVHAYRSFALSFLSRFSTGIVVVLTDSRPYEQIVQGWRSESAFRAAGTTDKRLVLPMIDTRVDGFKGNFEVRGADQMRVALDALLDVQVCPHCALLDACVLCHFPRCFAWQPRSSAFPQMMVRADFLVHGSSAMAEAAIYTNPALHCASLDVDLRGPVSVVSVTPVYDRHTLLYRAHPAHLAVLAAPSRPLAPLTALTLCAAQMLRHRGIICTRGR